MAHPHVRLYTSATQPQARTAHDLDVLSVNHTDVVQQRHLEIILQQVASHLTVSVARQQIVMAFANLIKNAIESLATGPKRLRAGAVFVSAMVYSDGVVVQIRDTGGGMTPQELAECRRLLPGRRNKNKRFSTGYGLSIAARNIAGHGGSMDIESQEDEGTCITIYLPRDAGEVQP